ncbi:hypothetical protein SCOR_31950 [Sulfidibacter corallicola]
MDGDPSRVVQEVRADVTYAANSDIASGPTAEYDATRDDRCGWSTECLDGACWRPNGRPTGTCPKSNATMDMNLLRVSLKVRADVTCSTHTDIGSGPTPESDATRDDRCWWSTECLDGDCSRPILEGWPRAQQPHVWPTICKNAGLWPATSRRPEGTTHFSEGLRRRSRRNPGCLEFPHRALKERGYEAIGIHATSYGPGGSPLFPKGRHPR